MPHPTSVRFKQPLLARLNKAVENANVGKNDIIEIGLTRFLDKHKTPAAIIDAVIRYKQEQAKRGAAK
jgi:hypothetical protein